MLNRFRLFGLSTGRPQWRDYFLQVSLIILSLLIATGVERCNQGRNERVKLNDYLAAIQVDLQSEHHSNENNLYDCEQDLVALERAFNLASHQQPDSLHLFLQSVLSVFVRGVFRSFPPTTFDLMVSSGDLNLIKDLELRSSLASYFAFRNNILKTDLAQFDEQTFAAAAALGPYLDLACLNSAGVINDCVIDPVGLATSPRNELMLLYRRASLRAFHLGIAVKQFEKLNNLLEKNIR